MFKNSIMRFFVLLFIGASFIFLQLTGGLDFVRDANNWFNNQDLLYETSLKAGAYFQPMINTFFAFLGVFEDIINVIMGFLTDILSPLMNWLFDLLKIGQ